MSWSSSARAANDPRRPAWLVPAGHWVAGHWAAGHWVAGHWAAGHWAAVTGRLVRRVLLVRSARLLESIEKRHRLGDSKRSQVFGVCVVATVHSSTRAGTGPGSR